MYKEVFKMSGLLSRTLSTILKACHVSIGLLQHSCRRALQAKAADCRPALQRLHATPAWLLLLLLLRQLTSSSSKTEIALNATKQHWPSATPGCSPSRKAHKYNTLDLDHAQQRRSESRHRSQHCRSYAEQGGGLHATLPWCISRPVPESK